jgi:hypothetical protein
MVDKHNIEQKLVGQRFGRLVIVGGYIPSSKLTKKRQQPTVLCICDCGSGEKRYSLNSLRQGTTTSCGCFRIENSSKMGKINGRDGGLKRRKYSPKESSARDLHQKYIKRNPGNLDFETFFKLTQLTCHYCGAMPYQIYSVKNATSNGNFVYNGLDRIDNSKGYDLDNVVTCCGICNTMRSTLSVKDFYNHIIKILNNKEIKSIKGMKTNGLVDRIKQIVDLLKFVLTLDDQEIVVSTIESVIETLEDEIIK